MHDLINQLEPQFVLKVVVLFFAATGAYSLLTALVLKLYLFRSKKTYGLLLFRSVLFKAPFTLMGYWIVAGFAGFVCVKIIDFAFDGKAHQVVSQNGNAISKAELAFILFPMVGYFIATAVSVSLLMRLLKAANCNKADLTKDT